MNYLELFEQTVRNRTSITHRDSNILIVDGLNTFIRTWAAVPVLSNSGEHINAISAFLKSLGVLIRMEPYSRCIVVFDGSGGSQRRRKVYSDYKNNRTPNSTHKKEFNSKEEESQSFGHQLQRSKQYLKVLPVTLVEEDHIEADDTIAHLVNLYNDSKITIVSSDRDFLQLVDERVRVYSPIKKKMYTPDLLREELGIEPDNYLLYRVLTGDPSDNIPGIKGLGLKTLLKEYPLDSEVIDIEQFIKYTEEKLKEKRPKKIISEILNNQEQIHLNHRLMQLSNVDISLSTKNSIRDEVQYQGSGLNEYEFYKMFREDNMDSVLRGVDNWLMNTFSILNKWDKK